MIRTSQWSWKHRVTAFLVEKRNLHNSNRTNCVGSTYLWDEVIDSECLYFFPFEKYTKFNLIFIRDIQSAASGTICAVVGFHCVPFRATYYSRVLSEISGVSSNIVSISVKYFVDILKHTFFFISGALFPNGNCWAEISNIW